MRYDNALVVLTPVVTIVLGGVTKVTTTDRIGVAVYSFIFDWLPTVLTITRIDF